MRNIISRETGETLTAVGSAGELQVFLAGRGVVSAVGADWDSLSMRDLGIEDIRFEGEA